MTGNARILCALTAAAALCVSAAALGTAFAAVVSEARHVSELPIARPTTTRPATGSTRQVTNVRSMQEFALGLYRRLAIRPANENLFFSPYSIYAALAMTAEGARRETADEMGRALRLPATLRRHGAEAATRPWDFVPVHTGLGEIAAALQQGTGTAPRVAARIDSLRKTLAEAEGAAQQAMEHHNWEAMRTQQGHVRSQAAELDALQRQVGGFELRIANALWGDTTFTFAPEFVRTLTAHYGTGGVRAVDYGHNAEGARERINAWVAEQTAQRIQDLLPPGSVNPTTRLVLTDAIWFKGQWAEVFNAQSTQEAPFRLAEGTATQVPLMHGELVGARYAAFRADGSLFPTPREISYDRRNDPADPKLYPGDSGFQIAELAYKGGKLSMVVLVPHSPDGLAALEQHLEAAPLAAWIGQLEPRRIEAFLPKFRLEQSRELHASLEAMGMERAFISPTAGRGAQFDGMTLNTNPGHALFVNAVVHKAFLEVNEEGTEAAAATGVTMEATVARPTRTRPFVPIFRADRPFLFFIRDLRSGAILFMGRFTKPGTDSQETR